MKAGLRILIADDHPVVRRGLKEILAESPEIVEIGEAGHPQQIIDLAQAGHWDVVILDLGLPGRGGMDVLRELQQLKPKLPVLILSMQSEDQYAVRTLRAGAAGYLTKEAAPDHLLDAIRKVSTGGRYVTAAVAEQLAGQLTVDPTRPIHEALSDREYEVLKLIGSGSTVGAIAERLSLSTKTVSTYRARILEKMHLKNNAELMQYAIRNHLID